MVCRPRKARESVCVITFTDENGSVFQETSLYYYKRRYYSPALGRFLSRDPIGYRSGMNLYGYVGDRPMARTDPLGLLGFR